VTGNEEGCCSIRISLFNMLEGEGGESETQWESTALGNTSVEMGQHLHGFCDPFTTDF